MNKEDGQSRRRINKAINKFQGRLNKEDGPSRRRINKAINKFQKEVIDPGAKAKVLRFLTQNISPLKIDRDMLKHV